MICTRRNKEIPKLTPTDYCMGCEEKTPETFKECMKKMNGIIYKFNNGTELTLLGNEPKQ